MDRLPAFLAAMSRSSHDVSAILALAAQAGAVVLGAPCAVLVGAPRGWQVAATAAYGPPPDVQADPEVATLLEASLTTMLGDPRAGEQLQSRAHASGGWQVALDGSSRWAAELLGRGLGTLDLTPVRVGDELLGILITTHPDCGHRGLEPQAQLSAHVATFLDTAKVLTQMRQSSMVLDAMPDAVIGFSRDREVILWNSGAEHMYGISEEQALGRCLDKLIPTDYGSAEGFEGWTGGDGSLGGGAATAISLINRGRWSGRVRQQTSTGVIRHVDMTITSIFEAGMLQGAVCMNRDVTELVEAERRRAEHERRIQALLDASSALTAVIDARGRVTAVNTAWLANGQTGAAFVPALGVGSDYLATLTQVAQEDDSARRLLDGVQAVLSGAAQRFEMDYDIVRPDGSAAAFAAHVEPMPGSDGGAFTTHTDISVRKAFERELEHRAEHDPLTGLLTRHGLTHRLGALVGQPGHRLGLIIVDLDRFKDVNDTLGHRAGDRVLVAMAERLRRANPSGLVARLSGDEFGLVIEGLADQASLVRRADSIRRVVADPLEVVGRELFFGCNVGIARAADIVAGPEAAADLIRAADTAMYRAKERGRNNIVAFDEGLRADVERRMRLSSWLERALEHDQFRVKYQGQYRCLDGRQVGVEALVRWHHPEAGDVSPGEFIAIAEESGRIIGIGSAVLHEACRAAAEWVLLSEGEFTVAVNLSPMQLLTPELVDDVRRALLLSHLPAQCLTLEVTEGALIADPAAASQALARLRALGVRISVDDFGTGYSSLAYLARFPLDELKVDRMFVRDIERDPKTRALTEGIIRIGHALGMRVIAEGVETPGQLRILTGAGADCYQGFLSSRAEPADFVTTELLSGAGRDLAAEQARDAGRLWP